MPAAQLTSALTAVDWNANVQQLLPQTARMKQIADCNYRLAMWSSQFEAIEKDNAALCFVRAMQTAGHHVAALTALALYKPAAASIREVVEDALYYSFFRTHSAELATLASEPTYFITKADILDYHKLHTRKFVELQGKFGLVSRLAKWYGEVSAIVHGQLPGKWVEHTALAQIKHSNAILDIVIEKFRQGEELVHHLFLCSCGREIWDYVPTPSKRKLSSGLSGDIKAALEIDTA